MIDKEYFARRAREEREREKTATTRSAVQAHAELAEEYERRLHAADDAPPE